MEAEFDFKDGKSLSREELLKVAELDQTIPVQYDPYFDMTLKPIKDRLDEFEKLGDLNFFKVVYSGSEIVGFHLVRGSEGKGARIATLWVHPDFRKKGIAQKLKQEGETWAREHGFLYLQTNVNSANTRMLELNRQNGFEEFAVAFRKKL